MNTPGSRKNDITVHIGMLLINVGFSLNNAALVKNTVHKKCKTAECLEILKEMREAVKKYARYKDGINSVLEKHGLIIDYYA